MTSKHFRRHTLVAAAVASASLTGLVAAPAEASEGGASIYLLGSGGPGAAIVPPIEGLFFANTLYHYNGDVSATKQFPIGGNVVAGVSADITADFPALVWVPTTHFAGGTLALGVALPFGQASADVNAVVTGPAGRTGGGGIDDDAFVVGDPLLNAELGWTTGNTHIALSSFVNIPIGEYREDQLANLAFHRWAGDLSLATTWRNDKVGWDLSAKTGFTFNGENEHTQYTTGTEYHLEAAAEKIISPKFSAGVQGYYFDQISGDSGPGATLGPFKGRVYGIGLTGAYNFEIGKKPATLRAHLTREFDAVNRLQGTGFWLDFSIPLVMKLPK